jgi:nucleoid-associated protein YgaU
MDGRAGEIRPSRGKRRLAVADKELRRETDEILSLKGEKRAAQEEAKSEKPEPRVYVVQPGDSLSKIAQEVYGQAGRWKEIFQANKDQIENPSLIRPGQKLRIPQAVQAEAKAKAKKPADQAKPKAKKPAAKKPDDVI